MNVSDLKLRTARLDVNLSADAVKLLRLCVTLATEGKIRPAVMQNEIAKLLKYVELSQALQKKITAQEKIFNLSKLTNSVSTKKFPRRITILKISRKKW